MMLNRTLHNVPGLRMGLWDAATSGNSREHYWPGGVGATPDEVEQAIIDKEGVGHWNFYVCPFVSLSSHASAQIQLGFRDVFMDQIRLPGHSGIISSLSSNRFLAQSFTLMRKFPLHHICMTVPKSSVACQLGVN